eukprot:UN11142
MNLINTFDDTSQYLTGCKIREFICGVKACTITKTNWAV